MIIDQTILKSLLNANLDFDIQHIYLADKEMLPELQGDKIGILEIKAYTSDDEKINIKLQLANQYNIGQLPTTY